MGRNEADSKNAIFSHFLFSKGGIQEAPFTRGERIPLFGLVPTGPTARRGKRGPACLPDRQGEILLNST